MSIRIKGTMQKRGLRRAKQHSLPKPLKSLPAARPAFRRTAGNRGGLDSGMCNVIDFACGKILSPRFCIVPTRHGISR